MVCLYCSGKTQVVNSRHQIRLNQVWRRRRCYNCSNIFSTIERFNLSNSLLISDNENRIVEFNKDKLLLSVYSSLGHRQDPINDAVALTDTILSKLIKTLKSPLVNRDELVSLTYSVLKRFDKAAAVHYSAYYPLSTIKE